VIIPTHSRNEYDAAVRSTGVRIIEVSTAEEYEAALGPRVAMVYILAGPNAETGPLTYDVLYSRAAARNIPVLVDAAAEVLTVPNVHLKRGATLVGYSGGKCMRGPQCAGLLLGRKDLIRAAWVQSAPHHGYSRSMKVGKEEAMGMLAAVEVWTKRDHKAEWDQWMSWMKRIGARVSSIDGVTTSIDEPNELSNHTPSLQVKWDTGKIGIRGGEVTEQLYNGTPRIALFGRRDGVEIVAYMMSPGEDAIVADHLHAVLSSAVGRKLEENNTPASADVNGEWDVHITYAAGSSDHRLYLHQQDTHIDGTHYGDYVARDLSGAIHGTEVKFTSEVGERHGAALTYTFSGTAAADRMEGDLDLGEYLKAKWTAVRHAPSMG